MEGALFVHRAEFDPTTDPTPMHAARQRCALLGRMNSPLQVPGGALGGGPAVRRWASLRSAPTYGIGGAMQVGCNPTVPWGAL
ncbi:hypothetical protein TUM18999_54580 [Pseudomonas tohonis]|uniref:Uncharacterized protein n=1 Tax=Pseudomonas tohonis TaxID=2725477 RepID=A0A6J4EBW3_9PSED|nr:hypothetical protein TUM18999_54580 [Pseudomonas tohonis]GJN54702.1 hypothetical protein TUM20286_44540 [Pseudomonas tohonis]